MALLILSCDPVEGSPGFAAPVAVICVLCGARVIVTLPAPGLRLLGLALDKAHQCQGS